MIRSGILCLILGHKVTTGGGVSFPPGLIGTSK